MSDPAQSRRPKREMPRIGGVVRGLLLLARGRAEGFGFFEGSRDGLLAGLAPPIAFVLVLAALLLAQRPTVAALCLVLTLFCAVLLPPVVSHAMARFWGRLDRWPRYATASIWSVWLVLPAYLPAMLLTAILLQLGIGQAVAGRVIVLLVGAYFLWLQWFMAARGLGISAGRAVVTVLALTIASSLLGAALQPFLAAVLLNPDGTPRLR